MFRPTSCLLLPIETNRHRSQNVAMICLYFWLFLFLLLIEEPTTYVSIANSICMKDKSLWIPFSIYMHCKMWHLQTIQLFRIRQSYSGIMYPPHSFIHRHHYHYDCWLLFDKIMFISNICLSMLINISIFQNILCRRQSTLPSTIIMSLAIKIPTSV